MKKKIIPILIQAASNLFALWFVFVKQESFFVNILLKFGVDTTVAQRSVLATLAVLITSLTINFLEWLLFEVVFKPVEIKVNFKSSGKNSKSIKSIPISYNATNSLNLKSSFFIHLEVSGGNKITNGLLDFFKSDIIIRYRPKYYQTEIANGWINSEPDDQNFVYKDKKENVRIYWTHVVRNSTKIEDSIDLKPELIITPTNFSSPKSQVEYLIGTHYNNWGILRFFFWLISRYLVQIDSKKLKITLKEEK